MIFDCSNHSSQYAGLGTRFQKAFDFLSKPGIRDLAPGRYDIEGNEVFALVSAYTPKPCRDAKWEAHRKYADIQVVVSGSEKQGFAPMRLSTATEGYIEERDIEFLTVSQKNYLTLAPGAFAVYFPQDAHQPGVEDVPGTEVRKIVVKVLV
jgi:YhcH/YjgK/YiaL family protein